MKQLKYQFLTALFACVCLTSPAYAYGSGSDGEGFEFNPSLMYLFHSITNSGTTTTESRTFADITFGYKFSSPIFLGAMYSYLGVADSPGTEKETHGSFGPVVGIDTDGVYMHFIYYAVSTFDNTDGSGTLTNFTQGSGFGVSLGYRFPVSAMFSVGPELSYKSIKYSRAKVGGVEGSVDVTYSEVDPLIAMSFHF